MTPHDDRQFEVHLTHRRHLDSGQRAMRSRAAMERISQEIDEARAARRKKKPTPVDAMPAQPRVASGRIQKSPPVAPKPTPRDATKDAAKPAAVMRGLIKIGHDDDVAIRWWAPRARDQPESATRSSSASVMGRSAG